VRTLITEAGSASIVACTQAWPEAFEASHQNGATDSTALVNANKAWDRAAAEWRATSSYLDETSATTCIHSQPIEAHGATDSIQFHSSDHRHTSGGTSLNQDPASAPRGRCDRTNRGAEHGRKRRFA